MLESKNKFRILKHIKKIKVMENKKVPFRDVELSKWDSRDNRLDENETLLVFNNDGGNYAFNEWWFKEGQYQFNEWCKDHPEYKWEYCKEK